MERQTCVIKDISGQEYIGCTFYGTVQCSIHKNGCNECPKMIKILKKAKSLGYNENNENIADAISRVFDDECQYYGNFCVMPIKEVIC